MTLKFTNRSFFPKNLKYGHFTFLKVIFVNSPELKWHGSGGLKLHCIRNCHDFTSLYGIM